MANTNNTNFSVTATYSSTDRQGYRMYCNVTTKITKVTKSSSVNPTKAYILLQSDKSVLGTATFSGDDATFSTPIDITSGTEYTVIVDKEGSSYTTAYLASYNLPSNNTDINFDAIVYYNGSWTTTTNPASSPVSGILSVTTEASTNATVTPSAVNGTFAIPTYTPSAVQNPTVSPSAVTGSFTAQTVAVTGGATQSPSAVNGTFAIPAYAVSTADTTIFPTTVGGTFSIPAYTPSGVSNIEVLPSVVTATFAIPAYTASVTASPTFSASVVNATFSILTYTVLGDFWNNKFSDSPDSWNDKY